MARHSEVELQPNWFKTKREWFKSSWENTNDGRANLFFWAQMALTPKQDLARLDALSSSLLKASYRKGAHQLRQDIPKSLRDQSGRLLLASDDDLTRLFDRMQRIFRGRIQKTGVEDPAQASALQSRVNEIDHLVDALLPPGASGHARDAGALTVSCRYLESDAPVAGRPAERLPWGPTCVWTYTVTRQQDEVGASISGAWGSGADQENPSHVLSAGYFSTYSGDVVSGEVDRLLVVVAGPPLIPKLLAERSQVHGAREQASVQVDPAAVVNAQSWEM